MLEKSQRLRSRRDFRQVYSWGRSHVHPMLVLYARPVRKAEGRACRIGFSISKKLGGAVERNRIKRRLREIVRAQSTKLLADVDVVFVGRSRLKDASFAAMEKAVEELFRRANLFARPAASGASVSDGAAVASEAALCVQKTSSSEPQKPLQTEPLPSTEGAES